MMKTQPDRRMVLTLAAATAVAAVAWPADARASDMDGIVTFEGDKAIPAGWLVIYLESPAIGDGPVGRIAEARIESDGTSRSIAFVLSPPASLGNPSSLRLVARLERGDGWLLARGSAQLDAGSPVAVSLSTVMY